MTCVSYLFSTTVGVSYRSIFLVGLVGCSRYVLCVSWVRFPDFQRQTLVFARHCLGERKCHYRRKENFLLAYRSVIDVGERNTSIFVMSRTRVGNHRRGMKTDWVIRQGFLSQIIVSATVFRNLKPSSV